MTTSPVEGLEERARLIERLQEWSDSPAELRIRCVEAADALESLAEQVRLQERERCAAIADQWSAPGAKVVSALFGLSDDEHDIACRTASGIAETIRTPPESA